MADVTPFFGPHHEPDGSIGLGCLSQWWFAPFVHNEITFLTAEHAMMYAKAVLFGDTRSAQWVLGAPTPREAKKIGRSVTGFDEKIWSANALDLVTSINHSKFLQCWHEREVLLGTGSSILVEASPYDRIWGAGIGANDSRIHVPSSWPGQNLLGKALMNVRQLLLDEWLPVEA